MTFCNPGSPIHFSLLNGVNRRHENPHHVSPSLLVLCISRTNAYSPPPPLKSASSCSSASSLGDVRALSEQLIKLKTDKRHKNIVQQTDMSKAMEVLLQGHAVTSAQLNDLLPRGANQNTCSGVGAGGNQCSLFSRRAIALLHFRCFGTCSTCSFLRAVRMEVMYGRCPSTVKNIRSMFCM